MEHIWTIENWEKNINLHEQGHRTSLRIRFDKDIDSEVRRSCKEFVSFLRKEYFFPLRVNDMGMCDICQKYWRENH